METAHLDQAGAALISAAYAQNAKEARRSRSKLIHNVLHHLRLPEVGWDEQTIQLFLSELAAADCNNFLGVVGAGEREGRVFSRIVAERHFRMTHGIGRSGDLMADQPKAAGSSIVNKLTQRLALDVIRRVCGISAVNSVCVLPMATGMGLVMSFLALAQSRPPTAKSIIFSRIDQKSCFKSIATAGFQPRVVELKRAGDALETDIDGIRAAIEAAGGPHSVLCVMTTTSTFAPRHPDNVIEVAKICEELDVGHVINNAYGLQCGKCCHLVQAACGAGGGRVDFVVQSTDKNFLVPIGGSIVASSSTELIERLARLYPGRASAGPTTDLMITLLQMGASGYGSLRDQRKANAAYMSAELAKLAGDFGLTLLHTPCNKISFALSLRGLVVGGGASERLTSLGSKLFALRVSGARVVLSDAKPLVTKIVGGVTFSNYGSHAEDYPESYLTVACAIGATREDIDEILLRFRKTISAFQQQQQT